MQFNALRLTALVTQDDDPMRLSDIPDGNHIVKVARLDDTGRDGINATLLRWHIQGRIITGAVGINVDDR
jgi:hypothetical protein